jgi:PAS domain S-box-containing protein
MRKGDIRMCPKPSYQELEQKVQELAEMLAVQKKDFDHLRQSDTSLKLLQQSLPMALYIAEPFGDYGGAWVSDQIEHITGFLPEQFMSDKRLWVDRLHPDDKEQVLADYGEIHKSEYIEVEYRWQVADGTYRWFRDSATLVRDEQGSPEKVIGIWLDVTDHKRLAEKSEKSKRKLDELVDTLPQIIFEADEKGLLTYVNRQTFYLTGYSEEDMAKGTNLLEFVVPEDRERVACNMQKVMAGEKIPGGNEYTIVRKDGSTMPVIIYSSQRIENGERAGLQGIIVDVSKQKQMEEALFESEQRYRSLFDNASDIIQILNPEGSFLYVNPTWFKTYGYSKAEVGEMNVFDLIHPECIDSCTNNFSLVLTEGRLENVEVAFMAKDGRRVNVEGNVNCHMENGQPKYVQCIFRDVTDRKIMEEELRKAHKLESIGVLAGGIAHDFNNILTGVLGNISLARLHSKPGDKIYEKLDDAERATFRAKDLTQQLLTFAKGGEPVKRLINIQGLLEEASNFVLRGSNVKCSCDLPGDLWGVEADEGQLSQVIHNLVINADQAMPEGGEIAIAAKNKVVTVDNNLSLREGNYHGIGITKEHLARIFDPYFSTKQKGHGLGLATAYSIVKNHGGLLAVDSILGKGSVFTLYMPAVPKKAGQETARQERLHQGVGKVLLMDDEQDVRDVASEMLKYMGYEVTPLQMERRLWSCINKPGKMIALLMW